MQCGFHLTDWKAAGGRKSVERTLRSRKLSRLRAPEPAGEILSAAKDLSIYGIKGKLEARVGIEPTHKGFADLSLTTWVPRLGWAFTLPGGNVCKCPLCLESVSQKGYVWSGRPGSNRRHLPWQGSTLPLSYSRSQILSITARCTPGQRGAHPLQHYPVEISHPFATPANRMVTL